MAATPRVLVGIDSSGSDRAVDWAARHALTWPGRLTVVHVLRYPPGEGLPHAIPLSLTEDGRRLLDAVVGRVAAGHPGLAVEGVLAYGPTAAVLAELAADADELVVGGSGVDGSYRIRPGPLPMRVVERAGCPVTVVPRGRGGGGVLIGVDGSDPGAAAVGWGFQYAARHGLPVDAVHVREPGAGDAAAALRMVADVTEPWVAKFPDVEIRAAVLAGPPAAMLAEASRAASVLVVGRLGAGARAGRVLGSVSEDLVRHGRCPVTVAR